MYFDDIFFPEDALYSSFTGERLAISEFNCAYEEQKISEAFYLRSDHAYYGGWRNQIYIYHDFTHVDYCRFVNSSAPNSLALG